MQFDEAPEWLAESLPALLAEHGVPGASVAVLKGGEIVQAAAGVTSLATKVPVDVDTVFQIGSITKIWTTTLLMQCVDEGLLDLDLPLRAHLPEFVLADERAASAITTRQLLCHVAGFEGDLFTDTGRGDDAIAKYVASLADCPQLFAPGETWSYNNTGFSVLGRLVEALRGETWEQALLNRLAVPLGLASVSPSAYEAILHRAATGHLPTPDGGLAAAGQWALARSNEAAGSMLAMTAADLVRFAGMHLNAGRPLCGGASVLSAESVAAMQQPQATVPYPGTSTAWGLGWSLAETAEGPTLIGHTGGTIGQAAFLRVVPEAGFAIALLTNGGGIVGLHRSLLEPLLREFGGVSFPASPVPPAEPVAIDLQRVVGAYSDTIYDIVVSADDEGAVWLDQTPKDVLAAEAGEQPERFRLVGHSPDVLIAAEPSAGIHPVFAFIGDDGAGRAKYLHYGRVIRRVA